MSINFDLMWQFFGSMPKVEGIKARVMCVFGCMYVCVCVFVCDTCSYCIYCQ